MTFNASPFHAVCGIFLFPALMAGSASGLNANPLVIDGERRPISMISEKVEVRVQSGSSQVEGEYTFQQEEDDFTEVESKHVRLFVPVLLPYEDLASAAPPTVFVGDKEFIMGVRMDIPWHDQPRVDVKLPESWLARLFEVEIPLGLIEDQFTVKITYTQPHFDGDICGYVPINPPKNKKDAIIVFQATPGHVIKKAGLNLFGGGSRSSIEFTPEHGKLIRVKCMKK